MAKTQNVATFLGEPLADMDREELLVVIDHLAAQLQRYTSPQAIEAHAFGRTEQFLRSARGDA